MGECFLDAEEVEGSIPSAPTTFYYVYDRTKKKSKVGLLAMRNTNRF